MASQANIVEFERDDAEEQEKRDQQMQDAVAPVLGDLNRMAAEAVQRRGPIEQRWLADLRQYHGVYADDVKSILGSDDSRSSVFINITRPKTNAWAARLGDMLFPNDERNWGIEPTPVPTLTREAKDFVKQAERLEQQAKDELEAHNSAVDTGQPADTQAVQTSAQSKIDEANTLRDREDELQRMIEVARECSQMMEREIDDQLTEAKYPAISRDAIDDMTKLGTGIMKGPIVRTRGRGSWRQMQDPETGQELSDQFELEQSDEDVPGARRVNPWHFFPDPDAETMEEAEYTLERHLPNKKMLRKMARELGFNRGAVEKLIKDGPEMHGTIGSTDINTLAQLRDLDGAATASTDNLSALRDRYCVWEFYGTLESEQIAKMIRAVGRYGDAERFEEEADQLKPMMVRVFFCGTVLLKITEDHLLDSGASLYSVVSFEKAEASIMGGVGVPNLMHSEQAMLNSAIRMMLDNAALATGPQIVIDKDQVEPEDGDWMLTPRKVWVRIKTIVTGPKERPFETYDIPMNQEMLAAIVQLALKFVDEAVSMPLIAQGEQGEHVTQTKGGMTMLFNSANVVFRRVVKIWDDDITAPLISRFYDYNMQFSKKPEIKGDMQVEARGTSVLLVRELQAEQMIGLIREFAMHPIIGIAFKPYDALRLVMQAMSINPNDVLLTKGDYQDKLKQMAEQPQEDGEAQSEKLRSDTALQVAQMDSESRKLSSESNERIVQMKMQQAFAELALRENLSLADIEAGMKKVLIDADTKLKSKKMDSDSRERALAAEIGVERENARRAEAQGLEPTGSGGAISMGAQPA